MRRDGLFDKFRKLAAARGELAALGIDPFGVEIQRIISPTEGVIHGRRTILAGTNNYLGLTFHPACIAAAHRALDAEGTGTTGSRMANGSYSGHRRLEQELAAFYGVRDAIVFSTGYQANLGTLAGLTGAGDVVLLDADCHASIYDGCRLAKFGKKTKFEYFKKTITLRGKIDNKKTYAKFEKGRLKITIPKTIFSRKIKIK